ncbi:MAG: hypothetical protein ACKVQJ_07300 [Pyrinomonadaceae bacterium]
MGILGILGLLLFLVGWIWMMVVAYKAAGALWAVLIFFFSLLAGLIFCIMHKTGWMQWGIMVVGWLLLIFGGAMAGMSAMGQ